MGKKLVDTVNKETHDDHADENIKKDGDLHEKRHPPADRGSQ
jgi:hypothetical protein